MDPRAILTIGYGNRDAAEFVVLLKEYDVDFLVDVRSAPYSRFKPEFSKDQLEVLLQREGIRYVFMGHLLGGRPDDDDCYVDGRVDYQRVEETTFFREGLDRLRTAWDKQLHVCLMCSEGRPEQCHRSKLIGRVLENEGIQVAHIDTTSNVVSQESVLRLLTGGQMDLFNGALTSRKKYRGNTP